MSATQNDTANRSLDAGAAAIEYAADFAVTLSAVARAEFNAIVADIEEFLKHTGETVGAQASSARAQLQKSMLQAKARLEDGGDIIGEQGLNASRVAGSYVRSRPWRAIGVAVVAGLASGILLARR